ncbi:MAG: 16S rRNA (cytosine(1402)-N(4))-methyltransferase RsmH [Prevotellaceae bacterium]|nr:16S rRNA (cytosine(1402)-N(4))-methyltransferase RsmH [Prevotellaceae bacterium]MDO4931494.1 16S rRNA (cytosine(1402)-N(4))-methyltransferase RsmH [Prevotellaceae bacterium]
MEEQAYHIPVLLEESVDGLNISPDGVYVDATFGGGGHSSEMVRRMGNGGNGRLFSFDQDADAERNVQSSPLLAEAQRTGRFVFVRSNFRYLKNWMRYHDVGHVDGLLADLGVSSHHFDDETRGFSFRFDSPLDMRMNTRAGITAAEVLDTYDEARLADIFYLYGELKAARKIAAAIVRTRQQQPIRTTQDFMQAVEPFFKREREKKDMAKLFQALRIEVNHEMDALRELLQAATEVLAPGGRLSVITYHSLEDRMVKNFMKTGNAEGRRCTDFYGRVQTPYRMVNNKVIVPAEEELTANPRSRSAKLRIAERCVENG